MCSLLLVLQFFKSPLYNPSSQIENKNDTILGGGFKYFSCSPLFGEDSHFDEHIIQRGWFNHQLEYESSLPGIPRQPPQIFPTKLLDVEGEEQKRPEDLEIF